METNVPPSTRIPVHAVRLGNNVMTQSQPHPWHDLDRSGWRKTQGPPAAVALSGCCKRDGHQRGRTGGTRERGYQAQQLQLRCRCRAHSAVRVGQGQLTVTQGGVRVSIKRASSKPSEIKQASILGAAPAYSHVPALFAHDMPCSPTVSR